MIVSLLAALALWPLPPAPTEPPADPAPEEEPAEAPAVDAPKPAKGRRPVAKPTPAPDAEPAPVPFPHPLITEILYAVPSGDAGDANVDGVRHASGDEFIELYNPHPKPIKLGGYKLADNAGTKPGQLLIVLPDLTLPPGACVVIFNGLESNIPGPFGDSTRAPRERNDNFGNAFTLSMKAVSSRTSLSNTGDYVPLIAPGGAPVQLVHWGKLPRGVPQCPLVEEAPTTSSSSIQRESIAGRWVPHERLDGEAFSPGLFRPAEHAAAPDPEPLPKGKNPDAKGSSPGRRPG